MSLAPSSNQVGADGSAATAYFAVSDDTSLPTGSGTALQIPDTGTTAVWLTSLTVHGLFPVTSGTHTFYLLAQEIDGIWAALDRTLTLVYLPTELGVSRDAVGEPAHDSSVLMTGPGTPITAADIAAERAETEAFNDARVAQELAEIEAKIEEIRAGMGNG